MLAIPLLGFTKKLENILVEAVLWKKITQLALTEKLPNWNAPWNKRRTEFLWIRVLEFLPQKKEGWKAKPKGPAVSHQGNQDPNVPYKHICYSVSFMNSLWKKGRTEFLRTSVLQFLSPKKMGVEEAKSKGPAVSYQRKHYLKELLTWMSFIIVFLTSTYTLSLNGTFQNFRIECLC